MSQDLTPSERLSARLYTLDADGVIGLYRDANAALLNLWPSGYNPAADKVAASKLVKLASERQDTRETRVGLLVDVFTQAFTDCDRAVKRGAPLDQAEHAWPFCKPELPRINTIATHWANLLQIVSRTGAERVAAREAADARARIVTQSTAARSEDEKRRAEIEAELPGAIEAVNAFAARLEAYRSSHPEHFATCDAQVRAYLREKWGPRLGNPEHRREKPGHELLCPQVALYHEAMRQAIWGQGVPSAAEVRAHKAGFTEIVELKRRFAKKTPEVK